MRRQAGQARRRASDTKGLVAQINSMPRELRLRPAYEIAYDLCIPPERALALITAADRALVAQLQAETDALVGIVKARATEVAKRLAEADRMMVRTKMRVLNS